MPAGNTDKTTQPCLDLGEIVASCFVDTAGVTPVVAQVAVVKPDPSDKPAA